MNFEKMKGQYTVPEPLTWSTQELAIQSQLGRIQLETQFKESEKTPLPLAGSTQSPPIQFHVEGGEQKD